MLWRHGDVLIMSVEAIPQDGECVAQPILAYGEVTGHAHRVADPETALLWRVGDALYLEVIAPTRIVHEEHAPIELPVGHYRVWQQREYVPPQRRRSSDINFRTVID